jgi:predicted phosphodiesterase
VKVAFIADIHANFPALCTALDVAARAGAGSVVAAGDLVGSGPHPVEVVRLLMQRGVRAISGNVERKVLELLAGSEKLKPLLKKRRSGHLAWTALRLADAERAWLTALPPQLDLVFAGVAVRVVHGSARSDEEYVFPSVTRRALAPMAGEPTPDVLVCGHSHIPFTRRLGHLRVVNCGSVGRPVDGDARGALAIVDFDAAPLVRATIVRFIYPVAETARDLAARGVPGALPEELELGIKRRGV